jgi:hypothetical protein
MSMTLFSVLLLTTLAVEATAQLNVSTVPRQVSYQGYLESAGTPFDGVANFKFVITCGDVVTAWSNDGSSTNALEPTTSVPVAVSGGAFAVAMGDSTQGMLPIEPEGFSGCSWVTLKIWVDTGSGFEELPAQPVISSVFALEADTDYRGLGGFIVDGGPLIITDDQDQQVISLIPQAVGPFAGPAMTMTNGAGNKTVSVIGDSAGTGSPEILLFDDTGTEKIVLDGATGEVRASSIRFDDDTVQTTAGGGGGGPDGDWIIDGTDMYANVSGKVGIGTNNPTSDLTLARPAQTQSHQLEFRIESSITSPQYDGILFSQGIGGTTTLAEMRLHYRNNGVPDLGFHMRNHSNVLFLEGDFGHVGVGTNAPGAPLEVTGVPSRLLYVRQERDESADAGIAIRGSRSGTTTANVAYLDFRNWDNNEGGSGTDYLMARISGGMQDVSGQTGYLRFLTNNGSGIVERMRIDKSGNVGIGTTTPTAALEVVGDLKVSGNLDLGTQTRYLSISPAAFGPELSSMDYKNNGSDLYGTTPGQLVRFRAPIEIPHGATITECRVVFDDLEPGSGDNLTLYLYEWPLFAGSGSIEAYKFSTGAPGTYAQLAQSMNLPVDNANYHYLVTVDWNTPSSGNVYDMRLRAVRITYTTSGVTP